MEFLKAAQHLVNHLLLRENCGSESTNGQLKVARHDADAPEVVGARLLAEAGAWDDADAGGLQQVKCVEHVRWLPRLLGRRQRSLGELDLRKCVHGSLDRVAGDTLAEKNNKKIRRSGWRCEDSPEYC